MNVGPVEIHVEVNHSKITLDYGGIKALKGFHTLVFYDILDLVKNFMVFDNKNLENSFAVVPGLFTVY